MNQVNAKIRKLQASGVLRLLKARSHRLNFDKTFLVIGRSQSFTKNGSS